MLLTCISWAIELCRSVLLNSDLNASHITHYLNRK